MPILDDFLKEHASLAVARPDYYEKQRLEWVGAVERLLAQLEKWLREADTEGVLHLERISVTRHEYGLGSYTAAGLVVHLGRLQVDIVPIARNTLGPLGSGSTINRALGVVQMSDGLSRYDLYRYASSKEEWWVIVDEVEHVTSRLDRQTFEKAMMSLLR